MAFRLSVREEPGGRSGQSDAEAGVLASAEAVIGTGLLQTLTDSLKVIM